MKSVQDRVNVIPLIAKADSLTSEECAALKKTILKQIAENNIRIYTFPDDDSASEDKEMADLKNRVPFAICGSNITSDDRKSMRCRSYAWGTVQVENLLHNDFLAVRNLIIGTHLIDLIDVTRCVHYENFRCRELTGQRRVYEIESAKEEERREKELQDLVAAHDAMIKSGELEVTRQIEEMRSAMKKRRLDLKNKRSQFEKERSNSVENCPGLEKHLSLSNMSNASSTTTNGQANKGRKSGSVASLFR